MLELIAAGLVLVLVRVLVLEVAAGDAVELAPNPTDAPLEPQPARANAATAVAVQAIGNFATARRQRARGMLVVERLACRNATRRELARAGRSDPANPRAA